MGVRAAFAQALHRALLAAEVPSVYVEFPMTDHGFDVIFDKVWHPAAQAALYDLERFLAILVNGIRRGG